MKIIKIVIFSLAIIFGLAIVVGLFLPSTIDVEQTITIDTPTNVPYAQVSNLRNMTKWDPWSKVDSSIKIDYSGPIAGLGAKRSWVSNNKQIGSGSMTIVKYEPYSYIEISLDLGGDSKSTAKFSFKKLSDDKTEVRWQLFSDMDIPVLGGYLSLLLTPKIEAEYMEGLKKLKTLCENMANKVDLTDRKITVEEVKSQTIICIAHSTTKDDTTLSKKYAKSYGQLVSNIQVNGMKMSGQPLTITTKWEGNTFEYENCIPVQNVKGDLSASVFSSKTYSGTAVKIEHLGSYDNLNSTYDDIIAYINQMNFEIIGDPWEIYVSDPSNTVEDKLITDVYFPVKPK